jgi:chemotaxis protein MotA
MNLSFIGGLVLGLIVLWGSILMGVDNPLIFANAHSILIVMGGTFAAAMICFPFSHLVGIARVVVRTMSGEYADQALVTIGEIVELARKSSSGASLVSELNNIQNPFLRECLELSLDGTISDEELEDVLYNRVEIQNVKYKQEGMTFKIIAKFPPAFGLIGTTLGMISLLQGMGGAGGIDKLGPAMSTALTATFWGLVMANMLLIPLGENMSTVSQQDLIQRRVVVEGVMLLKDRKHYMVVEEYLKSYLSPAMRNRLVTSDAPA